MATLRRGDARAPCLPAALLALLYPHFSAQSIRRRLTRRRRCTPRPIARVPQGILREFKGVLEDPAVRKVFHNYGFDRHVIYNHAVDVHGLAGDTMHMARLWDTGRLLRGGYSLEGLSTDLLGRAKVSMKDLFSKPKMKKVRTLLPLTAYHRAPSAPLCGFHMGRGLS